MRRRLIDNVVFDRWHGKVRGQGFFFNLYLGKKSEEEKIQGLRGFDIFFSIFGLGKIQVLLGKNFGFTFSLSLVAKIGFQWVKIWVYFFLFLWATEIPLIFPFFFFFPLGSFCYSSHTFPHSFFFFFSLLTLLLVLD